MSDNVVVKFRAEQRPAITEPIPVPLAGVTEWRDTYNEAEVDGLGKLDAGSYEARWDAFTIVRVTARVD